MADTIKTLSHVSLLEQLNSPITFQCQCGDTHKILLKDFDLDSAEIKPKELVRLKCVHHYAKLQEVLLAETRVSIDASYGGTFKQIIGNIYLKFITWYINRKRSP